MVDKNKLKGLIVAAGLTQSDVAKLCGMSQNTLSNKINGNRDFTVAEANAICKVINVTSAAEKAKIFLA